MSINIKFEKFAVKDKFKKSVLKRSLFTLAYHRHMAVLDLLHYTSAILYCRFIFTI